MSNAILIAITDPNIVYLLRRYAEESGFEAMYAGQEKELVQLAQEIQPALIVLQTEPSEAAWQQSLQSLKSDPVTECIPVVGYSCLEESSPLEGVTGFLQKSVLYSDFVQALEQAGVSVDRSKRGNFNPAHKGI